MNKKSESKKKIVFEVGGMYRNRAGWYEVLKIENNEMLVRYEDNGGTNRLDFESQLRIISNIEAEEGMVTPYDNHQRNLFYFKTIGYLAKNAFIEAIIPLKSKDGFDSTYQRIKGHYPQKNQEGYYIHHDEDVDKWGVEMRITFKIPSSISLDEMDFGPTCNPVNNPNSDNEKRINSNAFCRGLLSLGFDLGGNQPSESIVKNIPEKYITVFHEGLAIT